MASIELSDIHTISDMARDLCLDKNAKPIADIRNHIDGEIRRLKRLRAVINFGLSNYDFTESMFIEPFLRGLVANLCEDILKQDGDSDESDRKAVVDH